MEQQKVIRAPEVYRRMSEPFVNLVEANDALGAFQSELRELRIKHRIRDVAVVIAVNVESADGEGVAQITCHVGNPSEQEAMFAFGLGQARAERKDLMMRIEAAAERNALR